LNTYKKGNVRYPFNSLTAGNHQLKIKAWDTHNNSSERTIDFIVADNEQLVIEKLLNFPNPFTTKTSFFFEHNQACQDLKITIQVFTVSGKLVKTIQDVQTCTGFRTEGIEWNGRDDFEDPIGKGVYVYRVSVENPEGQRAEKFEKLVILR
jgi:flagellar hook assembly protein FlgD